MAVKSYENRFSVNFFYVGLLL